MSERSVSISAMTLSAVFAVARIGNALAAAGCAIVGDLDDDDLGRRLRAARDAEASSDRPGFAANGERFRHQAAAGSSLPFQSAPEGSDSKWAMRLR